MSPNLPFSEETGSSVIGPPTVRRWTYAVSKMFEQQLTFAYRERHGLTTTVVRFVGAYGPRQNLSWWDGPQAVFVSEALADEHLEVHGDGPQTRTFV
jgi:UDP-glucose 4-epimerase